MAESPRRLRSSKNIYIKPTLSTTMVQRIFRWEKQKRWSGKNSKGPCQKNAVLMIFNDFFNDFFSDLVNDFFGCS
jgi:hypothetical protein